MSLATPSSSPAEQHPTPSTDRVLLLGGIRSGKSEIAEMLVATAASQGPHPVRYVATAAADPSDPAWIARIAAHRARRPGAWVTEEIASAPARLIDLLSDPKPHEAFLVDDLGGWLTGVVEASGRWDDPAVAHEQITALAAAVAAWRGGLLVLVSPEVGLTLVPPSEAGRTFADAQGTLNRRLADVCDAVGLVVAGRTAWLTAATTVPPARRTSGVVGAASPAPSQTGAAAPPTLSETSSAAPAFDVPLLDEGSADQAAARLLRLDVDGPGLGTLTSIVRFAAATQGTATPQPWRNVQAFLLRGDHEGDVGAGASAAESARRLADAVDGRGVLALLAAEAGVSVTGVECPVSAAIEHGDALTDHAVDSALALGRQLADRAIDAGADLLVLASCGTGSDVAATAVTVMFAGGELATLIPRASRADGSVDDASWMLWCVAARDAVHRVRERPRTGRSMLAALGGGDLAVAAGLLLCAASRRTPVLIDGPVGAAATFIARDLAAATPRWLLLADHGGHPTTEYAATVLDLHQIVNLRLGLGEGCTSLTALPILRTALRVATLTEPPPLPVEPIETVNDA